jgi:hypothetical protein
MVDFNTDKSKPYLMVDFKIDNFKILAREECYE